MSQSRRDFLKSACGASTLLSLAPTVPALLTRSAAAAAQHDRRDTVLVVLQLSGGNDGLNTVVPYEDDAYGRSRRTLRLTGREVHKIDSQLGFHPKLREFSRLLKEGSLSVLQGVGYPNSDRDHDGAMRNWHTARPDDPNCPTGWVGRAIDRLYHPDESGVPGAFVGPIQQPFGVHAEKAIVPSNRSVQECTLRTTTGPEGSRAHRGRLLAAAQQARTGDDNPLADRVRRSTLAAYANSRQIEAVLADPAATAKYPPYQLAKVLKAVAQLIRAEIGIRIFFTELGGGGIGGFDNHANQRDNHAALLGQLSESVAAFADDLARDKRLDRVLLMTFSEFGRTVAENGRRGTGHGDAAPMFLVGSRLRGGLVGDHPSLTDLEADAPKFHTDFRQVYATALDRWLGLDSQLVLGAKYKPLDVFRDA